MLIQQLDELKLWLCTFLQLALFRQLSARVRYARDILNHENIRINLGYFGGTSWASLGPIGLSLLADINNDNAVDLADMAQLAQCWLVSEAEAVGDLNRNGIVNLDDFALLAK